MGVRLSQQTATLSAENASLPLGRPAPRQQTTQTNRAGPVPTGAGGAGITLASCGRSVTAHLCLRVTNYRSFPWRRAVEGAPSGQDIYLGAPEADF